MPNYPSAFGAFAENLSSGAMNAMMMYHQSAMKKIDREDKVAEQRLSLGLEMYKLHDGNPDAQKDILQNFIAPSFDHFNNRGDSSFTPEEKKTFFDTFDPGSAPSKQLFKEFDKIDASKNKGKITGTAAIDSFYKALEGYTGKLSETQQASIKFRTERAEREEASALFAPTTETIPGVEPTQYQPRIGQPLTMPEVRPTDIRTPSPTATGMGLSPEQAVAMGAMTGAGIEAKTAYEMMPKDKALTEREQYEKDPEGYTKFKAAGRAPEVSKITPSVKESRAEHFIKNYGPTRDKFDRIIEIMPQQRLPRLAGWFRTREIESKKKEQMFSTDELNQIEQSIMTGLKIETKIQSNINLLRERGATAQELRTLLEEYLKGK